MSVAWFAACCKNFDGYVSLVGSRSYTLYTLCKLIGALVSATDYTVYPSI